MKAKEKSFAVTFVALLVPALAILFVLGLGLWSQHQEWLRSQANLNQRKYLEQYKLEQQYEYVHSHVQNYSPEDKEAIDYVGGICLSSGSECYAKYVRYTYKPLEEWRPQEPKAITLYLTQYSSDDLRPKHKPAPSYPVPLLPQPETHSIGPSREFTIEQVQLLVTSLDKLSGWKSICEQQNLDVKRKSFFEATSIDSKSLLFDASFSYDASNRKAKICLDFSPYNPAGPYDPSNPGGNLPFRDMFAHVDIDYDYVPCLKQMLLNALSEYQAKYDLAKQAYYTNQKALQNREALDKDNQAKADALLK